MSCPCAKCGNLRTATSNRVKAHLMCNGVDRTYYIWVYLGSHSHGREVKSSDYDRVTESHYQFLGSFFGRHEFVNLMMGLRSPRRFSLLDSMPGQIRSLHDLVYANDDDCKDALRMDRAAFGGLCDLLQTIGGLRNSKYVSVQEKVAIFFSILAHHTKNRSVKFEFKRSGHTVSKGCRRGGGVGGVLRRRQSVKAADSEGEEGGDGESGWWLIFGNKERESREVERDDEWCLVGECRLEEQSLRHFAIECYIEKMDGYNPYSWNQFYNQNAMVYPPQQEEFGYDNRRNFDYHYQMPQVPSYYQDWSHTLPRNVVQPQHNFQPHQEYYSSVSSSSNEGLSVLELMRRRI
ncbi:hypothetical protein ACS0TY_018706 [Phlomoides rotata]